MSVEQAKACVEKLKTDEAFRARVLAEEDVEARMALIGAEGFDRSAEEIGALQELRDAELSGAVGGGVVGPAGLPAPSYCCGVEDAQGAGSSGVACWT